MAKAELQHGEYNFPMETAMRQAGALAAAEALSDSTTLRSGWELETGFHTKPGRHAFLTALEEADLGSLLYTKEDSTIEGAHKAEIVSFPAAFSDAATVLDKVSDVVTEHSTKGMTLRGCGVHVHVTRKAYDDAVWFRVMQALMTGSTDYTLSWWSAQNGEPERRDWADASAVQTDRKVREQLRTDAQRIGQFWDMVALRPPGSYCGRIPQSYYNTLANFKVARGSHQCAFSPGRNTPTMEYRLFRAARTRQVLKSYLNAAESLVAFASISPMKAASGGWVDATFPVDDYVKYVLDNATQFPALASRLRLEKFAAYNGGPPIPSDIPESHRAQAHSDLRVGCLVENDYEGSKRSRYVIIERVSPYKPGEALVCRQLVDGALHAVPCDIDRISALHVCKGATAIEAEE